MKPIKAVIGVAGTADAPGKGLLGFLSGIKNAIPMDVIKMMGKIGFGALKLLIRPAVQFFLSLFDFVSGMFKGADEAEKEKVGENEKLRLMFTRGIEGLFQGFGQVFDLLFVKIGGWVAEKLGFDKFAAFLKTIDVAANIKKSFDYIFGIGEYREKGGLPSDIGKLFAEAIPKAFKAAKKNISGIGNAITDAITDTVNMFKDIFSFENIKSLIPKEIFKKKDESSFAYLTRLGKFALGLDETTNMAKGGITTQEGLVNIHPEEAIIPLEKMSDVVNKINTAALRDSAGTAAPVQINNVTNAPVDASSSSVTNAAAMPISPPTNYVAIL